MFIIEKPYASELLIDTIIQNDWFVLDNESIEDSNIEPGAFEFISSEQAKRYYTYQEYPLIYSNSENAINWILENIPQSNLSSYIKLFKDKIAFRELIKELYPDFYFRAVDFEELQKLQAAELKFPIVVKPAVGFLSFGVHTVRTAEEWNNTVSVLSKEMQEAESLYPKSVIDSSKFIIEELIEGEEFAIDAYYNRDGEPVILNIFQHPFLNEKDVSDRIYIMSPEIMIKHMAKFVLLLNNIRKLKEIRNFPMHIEIRVTEKGDIIPIEVNPMRFAGWCTTDVAKYAWGINVYECFYKQKMPDWNSILRDAENKIYYFSMAEVPIDVPRNKINGFDYAGFLSNYSNVLEVRRINYKENPLFAVIFGYTDDKSEIRRILGLKTKDYIK